MATIDTGTVSIIILLASQLTATSFWAGRVSNRVSNLENRLDRLAESITAVYDRVSGEVA